MIGLKRMEEGARYLKEKKPQKMNPVSTFQLFRLPERTLKTPYYHSVPHFTDIWYGSEFERGIRDDVRKSSHYEMLEKRLKDMLREMQRGA